MKESLLKLAKLLAEDEKFLQEFSSKKSVDEQYDFAQKSVHGYTKDEFVKFLDELEKSYESKKGVLPEDLEQVSGGASAKTKAAAMAMLALTAAGGISNLAMPLGTSAEPDRPGSSVSVRTAESKKADEGGLRFDLNAVARNPMLGYRFIKVEVPEIRGADSEVEDALKRIYTLLSNEGLKDFSNPASCTDKGHLRNFVLEYMKIIKKNKEAFEIMLKKIQETFENEVVKEGIQFFRDKGYWTVFELGPSETAKKMKGPQGKILRWLIDEGEAGRGLYFDRFGEMYLTSNSVFSSLTKKDSFQGISEGYGINNPLESMKVDPDYFMKYVKELGLRLNRARVFSKCLESLGYKDEGQKIMPDYNSDVYFPDEDSYL